MRARTHTELRALLRGLELDELLLADGFDDAFLGVTRYTSTDPLIACYSTTKCLDVLVKRDGMTYEEAREFFDFNVVGAWVGPTTPLFIDDTILSGG